MQTHRRRGEGGQQTSVPDHLLSARVSRWPRVCVCASLFYLETILKQILNNVQLPSINISADKRWGLALSGLLEVGTCSDFWVVSMLVWVLETGWASPDGALRTIHFGIGISWKGAYKD